MLRRLIEFILVKLHIRKAKKPKDAIIALLELLPCIFAAVFIMGVIKWLGPIRIPWYRKLWRRIKYKSRRARVVLIGY